MVSPFCDDFFQDMLMNFPHKDTNILYHPRHVEFPRRIKFLPWAVANIPQASKETSEVQACFERGHKDHYVSPPSWPMCKVFTMYCICGISLSFLAIPLHSKPDKQISRRWQADTHITARKERISSTRCLLRNITKLSRPRHIWRRVLNLWRRHLGTWWLTPGCAMLPWTVSQNMHITLSFLGQFCHETPFLFVACSLNYRNYL